MEPTVHRMRDLTYDFLSKIRTELTNSGERWDLTDEGTVAGSSFSNRITDHLTGYRQFTEHCWGVFAPAPGVLPRTAGWCMLTQHDDPDLTVTTGSIGFYVHPNFRRYGVGRCLVQEVLKVARKNTIGRLLANPWNISSRSFFISNGFKIHQEHDDLWKPGIAFIDL